MKTAKEREILKKAKKLKKELDNIHIIGETKYFIFTVNLNGELVEVESKESQYQEEAERIKKKFKEIIIKLRIEQAKITQKLINKKK